MNTNPLMCDPEKGMCEIPSTDTGSLPQQKEQQKEVIRIVYFTDPICSSCWGIEPQLRKLKLEYGNYIDIEYRMGGLLPSWDIYQGGGINKASDVAHHWDEVSAYYDMPIDGDVWLEDPLSSSYPPSIAFKAAQMQSNEKAVKFLRRIREMVFLEKKNITKWEHISQAALESELDVNKMLKDYEGEAVALFEDDLKLARKFQVRGFPSIFFVDNNNREIVVYGFQPYNSYEESVRKFFPNAIKNPINISWEKLFETYPTLTANEFATLSALDKKEAENLLNKLIKENKLEKTNYKNGSLWYIVKENNKNEH